MRRATQGIDLGSGDTSGEEDFDDEPDSELADFVVGSDQPIEYASSSMPGSAAPRQSLNHLFSSQQSRVSQRTDDDLPEVSVVVQRGPRRTSSRMEDEDEEGDLPVRQRKRRKVIDDDSDDD